MSEQIIYWTGLAWVVLLILFSVACAAAFVLNLYGRLVSKAISKADLHEAVIEWKRNHPDKAKRYEETP